MTGAAAAQVETTLFRVLAVLRLVVTGYAVGVNAVRFDELARPTLAAALLAVLVLWSALVTWAYDAPGRRRLPLFTADLAVAVGLVLATPAVQTEAMLERHASTLPTFWVMTPVLAWAAGRRWWEAVAAAVAVSVADLSVRTALVGVTWGNIFLLLLAAGVVSYAAQMLREAAEMRAAAERAAAAHDERVRLARAVHDGVLQVLALVQRRGAAAGGEWNEIGRLAGEQEVALRALVQGQARDTADRHRDGRPHDEVDLMVGLERLHTARVTLTGPGEPVPLPARCAEELVSAVAACLDNVARHAGPAASAWVLVEDLGGEVVVTVRDDGPGIAAGRLEEAARQGRLGVSQSIRGRLADLGGRAGLVTAPGRGTEWELSVPRAGHRPGHRR